jgi:hypothetical protein
VVEAVAPVSERAGGRRDISWTGLLGGLLGAFLLWQAALFVLINPQGASRLAAIPLFAIGSLYLPAIWVSITPTGRRQAVLRWVLAVTLIFVLIGVLFLDPAFATLLLLPSTLLAIAAGLIFQGPTGRRR